LYGHNLQNCGDAAFKETSILPISYEYEQASTKLFLKIKET